MIGRHPQPPAKHQAEDALDLVQTFGPMAGMHAALERMGAGAPCGLVARFQRRSLAEVETAVSAAAGLFPILNHSLAWRGSRPTLVPLAPGGLAHARVSAAPLAFRSSPHRPAWRYQLNRDGEDVWFKGVWAHAIADGGSMLRFLEAISAHLDGHGAVLSAPKPCPAKTPGPQAPWLPGFLVERHLPYTPLAARKVRTPGVAWLGFDKSETARLLEHARTEGASFAGWLAAAASIAYVHQQKQNRTGRVSLDVPISRRSLDPVGGFGFSAGSLLAPVKVTPQSDTAALAKRIHQRVQAMKDQAWDENLNRFIGADPKQHLNFAGLDARGLSAPRVTVSWKRGERALGGQDGVRDIACFASSRGVHVSAHLDRNGLSLSLASPQSPAAREALLRAIVERLGAARSAERILSIGDLDENGGEPTRACPKVAAFAEG